MNADDCVRQGNEIVRSGEDLGRAIELYERAVRLDHDNFEANYNLGVALSCSARKHEAISCFVHAGKLRLDDPRPFVCLAKLYLSEGDAGRVSQTLDRAEKALPAKLDEASLKIVNEIHGLRRELGGVTKAEILRELFCPDDLRGPFGGGGKMLRIIFVVGRSLQLLGAVVGVVVGYAMFAATTGDARPGTMVHDGDVSGSLLFAVIIGCIVLFNIGSFVLGCVRRRIVNGKE